MARLFGTDGIRGKANEYPMTCEIALQAGRAVGTLTRRNGSNTVVVGRDTRISGRMLEAAIAAGAASAGVDVKLAGVIPTPGIAFLAASQEGVGAGIVISASHNPFHDNGIKIFRRGGLKLTDEEEDQLEVLIENPENVPRGRVGKISIIPNGLKNYAAFLLDRFPFGKPDRKLKLVVDAANGAASELCRLVFRDEVFDLRFIHDTPDGFNINDNCGSQHTEDLRRQVLEWHADLGLAFDGDADRVIAVDDTGTEITGDRILAICAGYAKSRGRLKNNIVVSTIMSNVGLTKALESLEINHVKTDVGDRKVLAEMHRRKAVIGGEDSGHMIFLDHHSTGDGVLSALKLLEVMLATGNTLSELAGIMTVYPQVLMNVEVDESKPDFTRIGPIAAAIDSVESQLGDSGRVLVRYSGTQPLLRVMVEGPEKELTRTCCETICQAIREHI